MTAYYNENDPFAAAWLRNLIAAGHIAKGEVDDRSIKEVRPTDLKGFSQCHFFAGIGVWSYALRKAGWPDDVPVWTGSCPCQSFSAAGQRKGFNDDRHLWPWMFELINEWRPNTVFGEQVASKDALGWLDIVSTDLEGAAYAVGAVDTCAAGFGAPHIRQRLYWVANSTDARRTEARQHNGGSPSLSRFTECGRDGQLANANGGKSSNGDVQRSGQYGQQQEDGSVIGGMEQSEGISGQDGASETERQRGSSSASYWSDCDWLPCIDGKARPVEPGTFPLVNGAANRVGRLRGYGNAIVAPQAQAFIEAFMEID